MTRLPKEILIKKGFISHTQIRKIQLYFNFYFELILDIQSLS